ncbi:Uncharacterised protein [uncultured archaeon]|nr:Uncharacterised protein [uncultured archaeon]
MSQEISNNKLYTLIVILSLAVVVIAAGLYAVAGGGPRSFAPLQKEEHTLSISGSASSLIVPDTASVSIGVVTQAATAKEASDRNAAAMTAVITALKNLGLEDKDIKTSFLSIQPLYNYSREGNVPTISGYSATTDIQITTMMIGKLGDIVDKSIASGANQVGGISFVVSEEKQRALRDELLANAVIDAREKANKLADSLKVRITGVKTSSISEGAAPPQFPLQAQAMEKTGVPIQPGEFKVTLSVQVTYIID